MLCRKIILTLLHQVEKRPNCQTNKFECNVAKINLRRKVSWHLRRLPRPISLRQSDGAVPPSQGVRPSASCPCCTFRTSCATSRGCRRHDRTPRHLWKKKERKLMRNWEADKKYESREVKGKGFNDQIKSIRRGPEASMVARGVLLSTHWPVYASQKLYIVRLFF